ncbi:hypothetical protein C478_01540 [Natrinema thermotolerans DSM 11552]|nr:hypothetical protein C478_01540 [Natrinema thermotolerans DSM 11552]
MNRRNVLVGLGTIVAGGGAALGTGAFSSVQADRTVSVNTAGDDSAYLGISVDGTYATDGASSENAVSIDLGGDSNGFNDDAVTTVNSVLTLSNNSADTSNPSITVGFDDKTTTGIDQTDQTTIIVETDSNDNVIAEAQFTLASSSNGSATLADTSETVDVNVAVRTGSETTETGTSTEDLTLVAN